ncbi:peptidase family C78-domain-containing protein [Phakopsora pachyrhizi]|uniref:Peptidase family C78-domain-containing protein n=1 Tax=Phakopsora pachyrhizi TaxID=170000 RepID=A0AAV0AJB5_PHAPC|nr:peptidase family C78-domain-containing protein [Phakopsora pachyrhizi]
MSSSSSSSHSKSSESLHRYKNTQVQFGLIKTIYQIYKTSIGSNLCLIQVSLCDETVINFRCSIKPEDVVVDSRFCSGFGGDLSWGCGYRNLQIIFSSICHSQPQSVLIHRLSNCDDNSNSNSISNSISSSINPAVITVPGLVEWQSIIQRAWNDGFDKIGSDHFSGKLVGKRTWIGTTELYVALSYLGIRVRILDFPRPTGPNDTHSKLLDWVIDYFVKPVRLSTHSKPSVAPEIHLSAKPPLYLQHSGHSRTIIGVEISDGHDSNCLLVLDPAKSISRRLRRLTNSVVGRGVSSGVFTSITQTS